MKDNSVVPLFLNLQACKELLNHRFAVAPYFIISKPILPPSASLQVLEEHPKIFLAAPSSTASRGCYIQISLPCSKEGLGTTRKGNPWKC